MKVDLLRVHLLHLVISVDLAIVGFVLVQWIRSDLQRLLTRERRFWVQLISEFHLVIDNLFSLDLKILATLSSGRCNLQLHRELEPMCDSVL